MGNKGNGTNFLLGAVVGSVLGAATALLFAPKPGKELREDLSEQCQTLGLKTQELAKTVSSQTSEWVGKAKEAGTAVIEEVKTWKFVRGEGEIVEAAGEEELATISQLQIQVEDDDEDSEYLQQGQHI